MRIAYKTVRKNSQLLKWCKLLHSLFGHQGREGPGDEGGQQSDLGEWLLLLLAAVFHSSCLTPPGSPWLGAGVVHCSRHKHGRGLGRKESEM